MAGERADGRGVREEGEDPGVAALVLEEAHRESHYAAPTAFVPVQILQDERRETAPTFELTFADGRRLVIPAALTGRPLRQLLTALRSC